MIRHNGRLQLIATYSYMVAYAVALQQTQKWTGQHVRPHNGVRPFIYRGHDTGQDRTPNYMTFSQSEQGLEHRHFTSNVMSRT